MKKFSLFSLVLAFIFIIVFSCSKKNDKPAAVTLTKANLIGTYKFTDETVKQGSTAEVDLFPGADACQKDDQVRFNSDSTVDFIDAGAACSPANNSTEDWQLPSSSTLIIAGESYTVKSFDGKTLVIYFTDYSNTPPNVYTVTLVKQ